MDAARLQALMDRMEIERLLASYCRGIDRCDVHRTLMAPRRDCFIGRQDVPKSRNEHRSPIVDAVSPTLIEHLIQTYGLWALFTVVMLESIGFPVPGEPSLVTAALYAGSTHQIDIVLVVLVTTAAAIFGDN